MRLPSARPVLQLKEVPGQASVLERKSGAADFFQYFTRSPVCVSPRAKAEKREDIPHEMNEILKEDIYYSVFNGLRPDFFQGDGLKPMKELSGGYVARPMTLTRPRDLGPGETAALTSLPYRPDRSIERRLSWPNPSTTSPRLCRLQVI